MYEIRGGPITHSIGWDETDEIFGYLVVGHKWDAALISKLSRILSSTVSVDQTGHVHEVMNDQLFRIHLHRGLPGQDGNPVSSLDITYASPELRQVSDTDWWEALIFVIYGGLAIGAVMFFSYRWVLQPLGLISSSLRTKDASPLQRMLGEKSELGSVANLVQSAFQDREDLKSALEERARLGRDLHDGVIQTLYASGMSLASIQANVRQDPERAIAMLEQTRRELNATIKDVRNFITRLETESEQTQKFETALRTALDFMRCGLAIECTLDIDAGIDTDLPMDIRAHLLQIVREAGSIGSVDVTSTISVNNADIWGTAAVGGSSLSAIGVGPNGRVGPFGTPARTLDPNSVSTDFTANLEPVTAPSGGTAIAAINNTTNLGGGTWRIPSISLSGPKQLNITGDVIIVITAGSGTSGISIAGNAGINLAAGASLTIYTEADVSIAGKGLLNPNSRPQTFQLWGTSTSGIAQDIKIAGDGTLSGLCYAPNADLTINGNGDVCGSFVADTIKVTGNAAFHYDESLEDFDTDSPYGITKWRELTTAADRAAYASYF